MKTLIVAVILLLGAVSAEAQQIDSCFDLYQHVWWPGIPDTGQLNPDSLMVDTCGGVNYSTGNPIYGKKYWNIEFQYNIIHLDSVASDSVLVVPWTVIDSSYPTARDGFRAISDRFGGAWLIKSYPDMIDSAEIGTKLYKLIIGAYARIDTVLTVLQSVPFVEQAGFNSALGGPSGVVHSFLITSDEIRIIYEDGNRVHVSGVLHPENYRLYNVIGQLSQSGTIEPDGELDLSHLMPGTYLIVMGGQCMKLFNGIH